MPLTLANAYAMALSLGNQGLLSEVYGPSVIPATGPVSPPNEVLGPVVSQALSRCGVIVPHPASPSDDEVGRVGDGQRQRFWDCLQYYAMYAASTYCTLASDASSITAGDLTVSASGGSKRLGDRLAMLEKKLREEHGIGAYRSPGLGVGSLPPHLPRPSIPPSQNYPPLGPFGVRGYRRGW